MLVLKEINFHINESYYILIHTSKIFWIRLIYIDNIIVLIKNFHRKLLKETRFNDLLSETWSPCTPPPLKLWTSPFFKSCWRHWQLYSFQRWLHHFVAIFPISKVSKTSSNFNAYRLFNLYSNYILQNIKTIIFHNKNEVKWSGPVRTIKCGM